MGLRQGPFICNCWAIINGPRCSNTIHTHPHSHLSGVYYLAALENCGNLFFIDPRPQVTMNALPVTAQSVWTFSQVSYQPRVGRMLVFPSWLPHGVEPNLSSEERICLSFNIGVHWLM